MRLRGNHIFLPMILEVLNDYARPLHWAILNSVNCLQKRNGKVLIMRMSLTRAHLSKRDLD
jgi:hypothetical protein